METNIGLNDQQRQDISDGLARLQADSALLYQKTHGFHWNVTGSHFASLHTLFETQYQEIWEAIDEIAERIRALGHMAPGSYIKYQELSGIKEEPGHPSWDEMVKQLVIDNEAVIKTARDCFVIVDAANDQATADVLTTRMVTHEKNAWMLRSLLE